MRKPPHPYKQSPNHLNFGHSGDGSLLRKGYWKGGEIQLPDKKPMANDPKMNIERELERNRDSMIVREPDTNYEARPGTDDEPDKDEGEEA